MKTSTEHSSQSRNNEGYDQKALEAASREVHLMLLREGSHWGIKACEEMGRVFMTTYRNALPSEKEEIERLNGMRKRLIDGTISDLAQLYGLIEEGEYDKASDYCKAAAEWYTQEIASLTASAIQENSPCTSGAQAHRSMFEAYQVNSTNSEGESD